MIDLDVIVPTVAPAAQRTRTCLEAVYAAERLSEMGQARVIVVANGCSRNDELHARSIVSEFNRNPRGDGYYTTALVESVERLGFTGAVNAGLAYRAKQAQQGRFVLLLNDDAYVSRDAIKKMAHALTLDERLGIVGPRTNAQGQFQGRAIDTSKATVVVPWVAFFCTMIRHETFEKIGVLDDAPELRDFGSDNEYCARAAEYGILSAVVTEAFCGHDHRTTLGELYDLKAKAAQRKAESYLETKFGKHGGWR